MRVTLLPPSPPTTVAVIESIATGAPSRVVDQRGAAGRVAEMFDDPQQRARIPRVYAKTKIATRRMAVDPLDSAFDAFRQAFGDDPGPDEPVLPARGPAGGRGVRARTGRRSVRADEIGLLVFVTSTGFIAPGVDVAIVKQLGLSRSVSRVVVNFMGCAAAMNAIRTASSYVRAHPDMKAMVVCIELSSVNAVFADDINDVITHSLFGDGCAALVIGASQVQEKLAPGKVVIRSSFSQLLDDAEDGIVLGVNHDGITCELSENLPDYIYSGLDPVVRRCCGTTDWRSPTSTCGRSIPAAPRSSRNRCARWAILADCAAPSWDVLARFGNMLSVSLIFVLETMVAQAETTKAISTGVAFSFAPGVTVEGILFDIVRR